MPPNDRGRFPKIKWVDEEIGPIEKHETYGLKNVTGYDVEVGKLSFDSALD